jgi:hypothetical protein
MFISVPDRIGFRLKVSLSDPDPFGIRNTDCDMSDLMDVWLSQEGCRNLRCVGGLKGVFRIGTVRFRILGSEIQMLVPDGIRFLALLLILHMTGVDKSIKPVLWIRIRIHRIHMFLGLPDPDPPVRGMDPDPDPSINMQK